MPHFHTVVFVIVLEVECPQQNTDALILVHSCHDLAFMYVLRGMSFVLLEHCLSYLLHVRLR